MIGISPASLTIDDGSYILRTFSLSVGHGCGRTSRLPRSVSRFLILTLWPNRRCTSRSTGQRCACHTGGSWVSAKRGSFNCLKNSAPCVTIPFILTQTARKCLKTFTSVCSCPSRWGHRGWEQWWRRRGRRSNIIFEPNTPHRNCIWRCCSVWPDSGHVSGLRR